MSRGAILRAPLAVALTLAAGGALVSGGGWALVERPKPPAPATIEGPATASPILALQEGPEYSGRFTFTRIRFGGGLRSGRFRRSGRCASSPEWAHDYPCSDINFAKILDATTLVGPHLGVSRILTLDDSDLFQFPIAYIIETGFWRPTPAEAEGLREYLLKGGFLIVDDFRGERDLRNFVAQMARVLPEHDIVRLTGDEDIFDAFFHIEDPERVLPPPTYRQYVPMYLGMFEDNDPTKRLMMIANFNNDHSEYWEYSDRGFYPIDLSNESYKFGVNYVIYAMTH